MVEHPDDIALDARHYPELSGMRFDGQRGVDATRPDRPFVQVLKFETPENPDMFGGSGHEGLREFYPEKSLRKRPKSRRRGPK